VLGPRLDQTERAALGDVPAATLIKACGYHSAAERLLVARRLLGDRDERGDDLRLRRGRRTVRLRSNRGDDGVVAERSVLDALVADPRRDHGTSGEERCLDRNTAADGSGPTPAEEPGERRGQRDRCERLQCATLGTLAAGEAGALVALAQVRAQSALLLARESPVELA
jgi:hypothetical protein